MQGFSKLKAVWQQRKDVIVFLLIVGLSALGGGGWKLLRIGFVPVVFCWALVEFTEINVSDIIITSFLIGFASALPRTWCITPPIYPLIACLGAVKGASMFLLLKDKTLKFCIFSAFLWVFGVFMDKVVHIDWALSEVIFGLVFGLGYLLIREKLFYREV